MTTNTKDMTGKTFGRLTVLERAGTDKYRRATWCCKCQCGQTITAAGFDLRQGDIVSCGCRKTTHGETNTRLHRIWRQMKSRCYDPNANRYKWYGGKGIKVCEEWRSDFLKFKAWAIAHGYNDTLSIDRIDSNKNYSPDNCEWVTISENSKRAHPKKKQED